MRTLRLVPWRLLEGTEFQLVALRALGARIGRRVHLHRGVDLLHGGWDLLDIEDDVTIAQDAAVQVSHLESGELVLGPVHLGAGATLDVHASVGPGSRLGRQALLTAWSWLASGTSIPDGERWDGIPARPSGTAPEPPEVTHGATLSPMGYAVAFAMARLALASLLAVSMAATLAFGAWLGRVDESQLLGILRGTEWRPASFVVPSAFAVLGLLVWLPLLALAVRCISPSPDQVVSRWSVGYLRVWLSTGMLRAAGEWLSGTLFWPQWLRLAGMQVGRGCEISTIIDVVASHVRIGDE